VFHAVDKNYYRPVLYERIEAEGVPRVFSVLFVKESKPNWVIAPNSYLRTLLTALNLGARLQWELCEEFLRRLDRESPAEQKKSCLDIQKKMLNIDKDAEIRWEYETARTTANEERLRECFPQDEQEYIKSNLKDQEESKRIIRSIGQNNKDPIVKDIQNALKKLEKLNLEMLKRISVRYAQLLAAI
jgi:hypothetical protein